MKTLSLSKSTPRRGKGNSVLAFVIASMTSAPSRNTTGTHSVHPLAISVSTKVWMNNPAADGPE